MALLLLSSAISIDRVRVTIRKIKHENYVTKYASEWLEWQIYENSGEGHPDPLGYILISTLRATKYTFLYT